MSLHYILVEPTYCSGSDLDGQASGVAWVEQSLRVVISQVVDEIELEHGCIGASTLIAVYSTEIVAECKIEMTG